MKSMQKTLTVGILIAAILLLTLTGCGMNKEKAIEQLGQAMAESSSFNSGKMKAEMKATVSLGADSIEMNLNMDAAFRDRMQTMAMKMSGEMMGMPLDTQTYQTDGFLYTLNPEDGKYLKQPVLTEGMDYQKMMTLSQDEMLPLYTAGANAAEDFTFTEEETGLRVQFTMPQEQLEQMQQGIQSMMNDEVLPAMEEQMRSSLTEQVNAQLAALGTEVDKTQMDALIEQQIQMIMEMERKLFSSLKIGGLYCDMLIEDGVINDQTIKMQMELPIRELVETMGAAAGEESAQIPESCGLDMEIHSLIQERNTDFEIEMPQFTEENTTTIAE